jgi:hypothetical protein
MDLPIPNKVLQEKRSTLFKNLTSRNAALDIASFTGNNLFNVESAGFKRLVGLSSEIGEHFDYYIGYQESEAEIHGERLDKKPLNRIFKSKYTFIAGDILTHDFKEQTFDLIFCSTELNYMPFESQVQLLKIAHSLLSSEGVLDLCIYSPEHLDKSFKDHIPIEANIIKDRFTGKLIYLISKKDIDQLFIDLNYEVVFDKLNHSVYHFLLKKK